MNSVQYHGLFPKPVLRNSLGRNFTEEELNFARNNECLCDENSGNTTSIDHQVLDKPIMKDIKQFVLQNTKCYIDKFIMPVNHFEPHITLSWFNYTKKNQFHHKHFHANSLISGVLYFQTIGPEDVINFHRDEKDYILDIPAKEFNEYNSNVWFLPVSTGTLLMFPSKVSHDVPKNETDNTRISMAFNIFLKGEYGNDRNLTSLRV